MSSQNQEFFDGETSLMDAHGVFEAEAKNGTWLNEFYADYRVSERTYR